MNEVYPQIEERASAPANCFEPSPLLCVMHCALRRKRRPSRHYWTFFVLVAALATIGSTMTVHRSRPLSDIPPSDLQSTSRKSC